MVFGNLGEDCGTGVAFTRDPATGENVFYGEYLLNAQGEDVVAGIRTPQPIADAEGADAGDLPAAPGDPEDSREPLPRHAGHRVHDRAAASSTCSRSRTGKRTGFAAVRIAVEMADEKLITPEEAVLRVEPRPAQPAPPPDLRPREEARRDRSGEAPGPRPERRAGRGLRADRLQRRATPSMGRAGGEGAPRPRSRRAPRTSRG